MVSKRGLFCLAALEGLMLVGVMLGASAERVAAQTAGEPAQLESPALTKEESKPTLVTRKRFDPRNLCITPDDAGSELLNKRRQVGGRIIIETNLLPTGGVVEVGLDEALAEGDVYFGALIFNKGPPIILDRPMVRPHASSESDTLVKKKLLQRERTVLNLEVPEVYDAPWGHGALYLFTCRGGSPYKVSEIAVRMSPSLYSGLASCFIVFLCFLVASVAYRAERPGSLSAYLNPIPLTAGADGRASLNKLQVLFFSLIVFGLITYFLLRTGMLTDISSTVLLLIGIAGVGSTAAKGADLSRTTLSPQNKAWLIQKRWLPVAGTTTAAVPQWRDLFSTEGEFDVYRYQSFVFSLVVGGALIIGGVAQLSSFEIPTTLLGLLGLSQVVYVGGKLVTPTSMEDLNKLVDSLREAEQKFKVAAIASNNNLRPLTMDQARQGAGQRAYDTFVALAADTATLFTAYTGLNVTPDRLEPSL